MSTKSFHSDNISNHGFEDSKSPMESMSCLNMYLFEHELENGKTLFCHLTECIKKILEERPNNALDIFENYSKSIRETNPQPTNAVADIDIEYGLAEIQKKLLVRGDGDEEEPVLEDDVETPLPDMMLTGFFYEHAGLGMNREELYRVSLAMRQLANTKPVDKLRFWGKIFGIDQNYYVAELDYREGEEEEQEEEETEVPEEERSESRGDEEEEIEDPLPKSSWKPPPTIPKEEFRMGANKKIYFVCHEPGKSWIKLPHVTPAQIQVARKIKKFFTGNLDAPVNCFPPFPGLEINLLRAQIARISAGTQISPLGFYTFDNDEEEVADEDAIQENYQENPDFVPLHLRELADPTLSGWVHHTSHILPQGRCSWWDPSHKEDEDDMEEDAEDENAGEEAAIEPERGPVLLSPINQDLSIDGVQPWSVRVSSTRLAEYAVAVVSSNLWPGAQAFAFGRHFDNLYLGWGHKHQNVAGYTPCAPERPSAEFRDAKDTAETVDPTPQEEEALLASKFVENEDEQEEEEEEEDN